MGTMARLLVVHHSPTAATRRLSDAVIEGARTDEVDDVEVVVRDALHANADDVLSCDGYLLGTSANFGYMSGALKHFFDSVFLHVGGALEQAPGAESGPSTARRPFGLWVHGRYDTTGAITSVTSITQALGWRQAAPTLSALGEIDEAQLTKGWELGATLAASVMH